MSDSPACDFSLQPSVLKPPGIPLGSSSPMQSTRGQQLSQLSVKGDFESMENPRQLRQRNVSESKATRPDQLLTNERLQYQNLQGNLDKSTLKVYLPNGGFNVVKFGETTDIKVT